MESRELDLAYCAGLFDGEGCISVSDYRADGRTRFHCDVFLGSSNPSVVEFFKQVMATGAIYRRKDGLWMFQASGAKASYVVRLLGRFLLCKKKQAELFIQFAASFSKHQPKPLSVDVIAERLRLSQEIRALNKVNSLAFHKNGENSVNLQEIDRAEPALQEGVQTTGVPA